MAGEFTGKVALVTGGGSGMGKSAAQRFAEEGAKVAVVDLRADAARHVADLIRTAGGEAVAIAADVAAESDNRRMVDETLAEFGRLDVVFLNAGFLGPDLNIFDCTADAFDRIMGINLRGCFFGIQAVARALPKGGAIVVTASTAGHAANQYNFAYTASKHGALGLVRGASEALGQKGVRINAICPGVTSTPLIGMPDSERPVPGSDLPTADFCGVGQPQHIAELALFLASPRAGFIHGAAINADAGLMSLIPSARIEFPT